MKKRLPLIIQSFEKLRRGGYIYVDKRINGDIDTEIDRKKRNIGAWKAQ